MNIYRASRPRFTLLSFTFLLYSFLCAFSWAKFRALDDSKLFYDSNCSETVTTNYEVSLVNPF